MRLELISDVSVVLPWTKKKEPSSSEIRGEKNAVPRVISGSIMLAQAQSAQGKSDPPLSATFALRWSHLIEHDTSITRGTLTAFFSPRISRMVLFFFFLSRVVYVNVPMCEREIYAVAKVSIFQLTTAVSNHSTALTLSVHIRPLKVFELCGTYQY